MRLINLEGDTNFTLQNQSEGSKAWALSVVPHVSLYRCVSPFSRGEIFTRTRVSFALVSLRKNGDYS